MEKNKIHTEKARLLAQALKFRGMDGVIKLHVLEWENRKKQYIKDLERLQREYDYAPESFENDDYLNIPNSIEYTERGIEVCDIYIKTYKEAL